MAGHSHWAGIKHKKGRADKQKSKIFSKISREITVAAKLGDKNPDLNSRLRSIVTIGVKLPSDDLIGVILTKNFSDKQIKVNKKQIDYIIKRIDRSYEKISQFILTLDKYSLKKGTPFSLKLIKEVLKMI